MLAYSKITIGDVPAGVRFDDPDARCLHVTAVVVVEALPKRYSTNPSLHPALLPWRRAKREPVAHSIVAPRSLMNVDLQVYRFR